MKQVDAEELSNIMLKCSRHGSMTPFHCKHIIDKLSDCRCAELPSEEEIFNMITKQNLVISFSKRRFIAKTISKRLRGK